ncbi:MAG TPA: ATP-binding protein [Steroidobacteraceae bacterium]|nr:ATP-binding protein [Steroidobacteraceae bacterium]
MSSYPAPETLSSAGAISASATTATLRRWVTIAGVVLIALIVLADSYEAWQDYRTAIRDNERTQLMLSRVLSEQTARMVQEVDVVLTGFAEWRLSAEGSAADERTLQARLRNEIARLPFVYSATVTGPDGDVLAVTGELPIGNRSLKKRPAFAIPAQAHDNALYVSPPFVGARDHARTFPLSRRLSDADGGFAGVVVARVSYDYLAQFYAAVNVVKGTSIRLAREDGVVLAQYPGADLPIADDLDVRAAFAGGASTREQVHYDDSGNDRRVEVFNEVVGYPIVVEITRPRSDVLQPWMHQELASAARTLILAVLAGLLLFALRMALDRHQRMELERRRLEEALAAAQRVEALGFLAASVAHDFNNVLTAIVGYAELARGSVLAGSPRLEHLERLLAAAERARRLVRRVLTFDPRRSLGYQPFALEPVLVEVVQQIQTTLPESVTLRFEGLDRPVRVLGDPTEVHQVLMNLCMNAVQAMPHGGRLGVRLDCVEVAAERDLTIGRLLPGHWVRVLISDTGVGLTEAQQRQVFEPFYTTRHPSQGTGIGLTVVRNVIATTQGALEVESRPGAGTRMSVYWRALESEAPASPQPNEVSGIGQAILLVDDEAELVTLSEEVLASLGYEPVGFSDPQAALQAFRTNPDRFSAVLTDERMPSLRGLDLASNIHRLAPRLPVILMTGHRNADLDRLARAAGVVEVLDKPLRVETLRAALARHLPPSAG